MVSDLDLSGRWPQRPQFAVHVGRGKCVQCRRYVQDAPAIVFHLARTSLLTRHYVLCMNCLDVLRDRALDWHQDAVARETFGGPRHG